MQNKKEAAERDAPGDLQMPSRWTVFAPLAQGDPTPPPDDMNRVPENLTVADRIIEAKQVVPTLGQYDFTSLFGERYGPDTAGQVAYIFIPLCSAEQVRTTIGMGGDCRLQAWVNGTLIAESDEGGERNWPPSITDHVATVQLEQGANVLVVRLVGGKGSALLALGGPRELRAGHARSILSDPFHHDSRWQRCQQAKPGGKPIADIGSRRELFVDDFLIDGLAGSIERRLSHPIAREVVFHADQPWEGKAAGYFTMLQDDGRILAYYSARPTVTAHDESREQFACVLESTDGITFTRPHAGLHEFAGSTRNNIIWRGTPGHNFTPFRDLNPQAPEDQRFKAIAYHVHGKALGAYVSGDGIRWRTLVDKRIITQGNFDSQNLAFWDAELRQYICYFRNNRGGLRRVMRCVSPNFIDWSEPQELTYADEREEQLYTNAIQPYFRAPHIYIGMPGRYVPERTKVAAHPHYGVCDTVLMTSRDGTHFERWEEGFIRPGPEPEVWTDRNNYAAWGVVQTSPHQMSVYWGEHYRHPGCRLRRGTLRLDGFASLHAGGRDVGEMLTRPLTFSGDRLIVNYATSAIGSIRVGICDQAGQSIQGFHLIDSDVLFGNELQHAITWRGKSDIGQLAGTPIRLRVRLHDADLFSLRCASGTA